MAKLRASMGYVELSLPDAPGLLEAAGRVALAHVQLELMLRMTLKTISGLSVKDALDATQNTKSWELRKLIVGLFKEKTADKTRRLELAAILGRCEKLSGKRNHLLHNAWAISHDGSIVAKGINHAWGQAATATDLNQLAQEIGNEVNALNQARLNGFIRTALDEYAAKAKASEL